MLSNLVRALLTAPDALLWVVAKQLRDQVISYRAEDTRVLVRFDKLTVVTYDFPHASRLVLRCSTLLLVIFKRILTTKHLEKEDAEAKPVDRHIVLLKVHHFGGHVLKCTAKSCSALDGHFLLLVCFLDHLG